MSLENNTTHELKKGENPCECSSKNKDNSKCNGDAYWRWKDEEYCDRHLPLEGRFQFVLNNWTVTDDKDLLESDTDTDSDSEEESD